MSKSIRTVFIAGAIFAVTACEYMPFAFGELEGRPAPGLADWRQVADVSIVQLETLREGEPYSVNLWMIADETHLYVFGGDEQQQWMTNMESDPHARVQIDGQIYTFTGSRVTDAAEFGGFAQAWLDKYGSDHTESTPDGTFLYRLDPK